LIPSSLQKRHSHLGLCFRLKDILFLHRGMFSGFWYLILLLSPSSSSSSSSFKHSVWVGGILCCFALWFIFSLLVCVISLWRDCMRGWLYRGQDGYFDEYFLPEMKIFWKEKGGGGCEIRAFYSFQFDEMR